MKARKQKNTPRRAPVARIGSSERHAAEIGIPVVADQIEVAKPPSFESFRFSIWWELAAVTAAYILVVFVLCPRTPLIAFPVHHDDFRNLARTEVVWVNWRPVSYLAVRALAELGWPVYYLTL